MELHSASRTAYAYFDRIEALAQAEADTMFEIAATKGPAHHVALPAPVAPAPEVPDEIDHPQVPRRVDLGYLTIMGISLILAGAVATATAMAMPTPGAATLDAVAITGCAAWVAWRGPISE
ncbi:hypothetical protein [Cupriavidus necator]